MNFFTFIIGQNILKIHILHMGEISQGVQSMEMMSYFLFFLATVFGNLEVWKVKKLYIFLKYISAGVKGCFRINHINLLYSII